MAAHNDNKKIAELLLVILASDGTLKRVIAEVPEFQTQIEGAFEWMSSTSQCTHEGLQDLAAHLGEVVRKKLEAVNRGDFESAAYLRDEECAVYHRVGLRGIWSTRLGSETKEQIDFLSRVISQMQSSKCEPAAGGNAG